MGETGMGTRAVFDGGDGSQREDVIEARKTKWDLS